MSVITPVILCGGSGTRLWPRSRHERPKPFLKLVGECTLFEAALGRCADRSHFAAPLIVTGKDHLELVESQLGQASGAQVIVEPEARNTAAAIALAARLLPRDAIMLVCPSDHYIADEAAFADAAQAAAQLARDGRLVAFGIRATSPETGYGYIRRGQAIDGGFLIDRFVEKPDLARAQAFLADGSYCWNGGLFAFRAGDFLDELAAQRPALGLAVEHSVQAGMHDGHRFHPDAAAFAGIVPESVDYAVMEGTERAAMVPADMGWSDIGNWRALYAARSRDSLGNAVIGRAELVRCENVMVDSDGRRVSIIGLKDVIVVVDGDEVLVMSAQEAQQVGKLQGAAAK